MGLFKKIKKQTGLDKAKKIKKDLGIRQVEKGVRDVAGKVERAGMKDTTWKAGKQWRKGMKEGRDIWQGTAESISGKGQRDIAESQAKVAKKEQKLIEAQRSKEAAELKEAEQTRKKKLKAAQQGRRSLLGG